jgi:hypothetical protein
MRMLILEDYVDVHKDEMIGSLRKWRYHSLNCTEAGSAEHKLKIRSKYKDKLKMIAVLRDTNFLLTIQQCTWDELEELAGRMKQNAKRKASHTLAIEYRNSPMRGSNPQP